jgi:hypothetical protein
MTPKEAARAEGGDLEAKLSASVGPTTAPKASELSEVAGGKKLVDFVADRMTGASGSGARSSVGQMTDTLRQLYGMTEAEARKVIETAKEIHGFSTIKIHKMGEFVPSGAR